MHADRISERAPREVSAAELRAMSGEQLHQLGALIGRELLAELPRSPLAPEPLAGAIFDFAEQLVQIGTQRVHSIEVSGDDDLGWYDEPVYGEAC